MADRFRVLVAVASLSTDSVVPDIAQINATISDPTRHFTATQSDNLLNLVAVCNGQFHLARTDIDDSSALAKLRRAEDFATQLTSEVQNMGLSLEAFDSIPSGNTWIEKPGILYLHPLSTTSGRTLHYHLDAQTPLQAEILVAESNIVTLP